MRGFALSIGIGLLTAALCGAALVWDGSAYLFHLLDTHTLYTPHYRYATAPIQAFVLLAAQLTSALPVLKAVFSLAYALVPALALAASWLVVRREARQLFVWAALGIALGTLPGQFFFVSEAIIAVQLFWPIWLAILVGAPPRLLPLMVVLTLLLVFTHPFAIPLLGLAALLASLVGWRSANRTRLWAWAAGLGATALLSAGAFVLLRDTYQDEQLSTDVLRYAVVNVAGLPLVALLLVALAAVALAAMPRLIQRPSALRFSGMASLVLLGGAGVLLTLWARDQALWKHALDFRFLVPLSALPLLTLAAWDASRPLAELGNADGVWLQRVQAMQVAGGIFALVLAMQSAGWYATTSRLQTAISETPWACLSAAPVAWLAETPLDHWSVTPYALLVQGQTPQKLVLAGDGCGSISTTGPFQLNGWTSRSWQGGWFNLEPVRDQVGGEQGNAQACTFQFTTGWHQTESNGPYWWRWSDGRSPTIRVLTKKDLNAAFYGQIETLESPNTVDLLVNGASQARIELAKTGLQPLEPIEVALKQGVNTVQFVSKNPPVETQGRPLALSLDNLVLASGDTTLACSFHP